MLSRTVVPPRHQVQAFFYSSYIHLVELSSAAHCLLLLDFVFEASRLLFLIIVGGDEIDGAAVHGEAGGIVAANLSEEHIHIKAGVADRSLSQPRDLGT